MTVKELIEELKEYPDDYNLFIGKDNGCEGYDEFYIGHIYKVEENNSKTVMIEIW